jgi:peptide-methionine (S)-S-oxide reductase
MTRSSRSSIATWKRLRSSLVVGGLALAVAAFAASRLTAETAQVVPAPALDEPAGNASFEVAILAGGCFWGVQGVFQHVTGVANAVSGYAGGDKSTAHYEIVGNGDTGHAEAVQVTFDPRQISYGRILQIFFSVAHDPTELNRQGPDWGKQYRSAIFPASAEQAKIAKAYIDQLNASRLFKSPVVTTIEGDKTFYAAEDYHQDYLTRHPNQPYIVYNDLPKIEDLKRLFTGAYRPEPVLVSAKSAASH